MKKRLFSFDQSIIPNHPIIQYEHVRISIFFRCVSEYIIMYSKA